MSVRDRRVERCSTLNTPLDSAASAVELLRMTRKRRVFENGPVANKDLPSGRLASGGI